MLNCYVLLPRFYRNVLIFITRQRTSAKIVYTHLHDCVKIRRETVHPPVKRTAYYYHKDQVVTLLRIICLVKLLKFELDL